MVPKRLPMVALVFLVQGCAYYIEPSEGPKAQIRFVSNVYGIENVVVNSYETADCKTGISWVAALSGIALSHQRKKMDMPLGNEFKERDFTEIIIKAEHPYTFTMNWSFYGLFGLAEQCTVATTFFPVENQMYEASFSKHSSSCRVDLTRIINEDGSYRRTPENTAKLVKCSTAPAQKNYTPFDPVLRVTDFNQRYEYNGFSILPPNGADWYASDPPGSRASHVGFKKKIDAANSTYRDVSVSIQIWKVPYAGLRGFSFGSAEEFEKWMIKDLDQERADITQGGTRSRTLQFTTTPVNSPAPICVRYHWVTEESILIVENDGFWCVHPHSPRYVVDFGSTQKRPKDARSMPISAEIESFLNGVRFTSVR